MKEDKRLLTEILKWIRMLMLIVFIAGGSVFVYAKYMNSRQPEITSSFVNGKLEAVSDLTTSELAYTGLIRYSEGKIPFLTQNSFCMLYTASIRAGIDLSKASIRITENKVMITLPGCEIQSVDIDADSIEFYDEHWALFNWTEKTDVIDTVTAAKEDVMQKVDTSSLLKNARHQTEVIIEELLKDAVGNRELVIQ